MNLILKTALVMTLSLFSLFSYAQSSSQGTATYYGDKWVGKPTKSGELLTKELFTCAHMSYPVGTLLKVKSMINQKAVVVRVNDKEPATSEFIVTVTRAGAEILGIIKTGGKGLVDVEAVKDLPVGPYDETQNGRVAANFDEEGGLPPAVSIDEMPSPIARAGSKIINATPAAEAPSVPHPDDVAPKAVETFVPKAKLLVGKGAKPLEQPKTEPQPQTIAALDAPTPMPVKKVAPVAPAPPPVEFKLKQVVHKETTLTPDGFAVQFGAMDTYEKAIELVTKLNTQDKIENVLITTRSVETDNLYKVLVGPFEKVEDARQYRKLCQSNKIDCFLVDLKTMKLMQ